MASGYNSMQHTCRTFPSSQKVLWDRDSVQNIIHKEKLKELIILALRKKGMSDFYNI